MPRSRSELGSLLAPLAAYLFTILLVAPWGDYPLNDDWIYARIGKRFAETGRFVFDHDTGSAFIGQGLIAAPVIRLLGFSHTHLRELTMVFGAATILLLWVLLRYAEVRPAIRAACLLVIVWNPLFGYLSLTFMTEIYAYCFALLGAAIWMRERSRHGDGAVVSWAGALGSAAVIGFGFWIRQYSVLVFPALLLSCIVAGWPRVRSSMGRLAGSAAVFSIVVAAYFVFARTMAEVPMADYSKRLGRIWPVNLGATFLQGGIFMTYMSAFLLALLVMGGLRWSRRMVPATAAVGVIGVAAAVILLHTPPHLDIHPVFPFLSNVVRNAGVGPILLPDIQLYQMRSPAWPSGAWGVIECVLLIANLLWVPVMFAAPRVVRKGGVRAEVLLFALLFAAASLTVTTFVDRLAGFDRYYLPETFALALAVGVILSDTQRVSLVRFGVAVLPLAFFTVAGLHDYFRWSDAGWELYREALRSGISPANIEASYEMNGWYAFTMFRAAGSPTDTCDIDWFCLDNTYRIGMNVYGGYRPVRQVQPRYWLAGGPPVVLSKR